VAVRVLHDGDAQWGRRPYTRPPLSKELLVGEQEPDGCALACDGLDVEWRLGATATGLDRERRELTLGDGERLTGRVVAAVAFNAARRLAFYRRRLAAMPPLEDLTAEVAADEKALVAA
jgi:hypothetical protein